MPWIEWEESLAHFLHVYFLPQILVLQVVVVVATVTMVLPAAWLGAGLACVPPWHVESTAEAHVPIVVVLVQG